MRPKGDKMNVFGKKEKHFVPNWRILVDLT
jgi:hypothetical protein